jgi:uncharacterized RDD family membrane protein YckC
MPVDAEFCSACGTQVIRIRPAPPIVWNPEMNVPAPVAESEYPGDVISQDEATVPNTMVYAGFWLRAVAYVIDMPLVALLSMPLLALVTPLAGNHWDEYSKLPMQEMFNMQNPAVRPFMLVALPAVLFCGWIYFALCESSSWQGTPGKRLLGLRVTNLNGRPISFGRASGRFLGRIVTGFVPFGIGYVMAGVTARKQALHDMIAGCLVLRRK